MYFRDYPIIGGESELPLYLMNMGLHLCQDHIIREDGFHYPQILYCTRGKGTLVLNGKKISVKPYYAIFLPARCPHEYYSEGDVWDIHWVVPAGYAAENIFKQLHMTEPAVYILGELKTLEHIFRKMHSILRSDSLFGNYKAAGYLYDFIIEFYSVISSTRAFDSPNSTLTAILDYININFALPVSMEDLCAVSGVSKQHICRLFRNTLNCRPMEYVAKRRIQAAKELLTGSDKSIENIAIQTGFGSISYFCKQFKRYEGITPSMFKNTV